MLSYLCCRLSHSSYCFFFFLMIRRPPRSTLFPTRRSSDLTCWERRGWPSTRRPAPMPVSRRCAAPRERGRPTTSRSSTPRCPTRTASSSPPPSAPIARSEEHTSELQSRLHLVCRLLLEKKKN